jgi:hypothetical protein
MVTGERRAQHAMPTPLGCMIDGRVLALAAPAGDTTAVMGGLLFGLFAVTTLAILLGGGRRPS